MIYDQIKEKLESMINMQMFEEALEEALSYLPDDDGSIKNWIFDVYYEPYREDSMKMLNHNIASLEKYEYYYGIKYDRGIKTLLYDECENIVFYNGKEIVKKTMNTQVYFENDKIILVSNMLDLKKLAEHIYETEYKGTRPNYKEPVYVYYEEEIFEALIQCADLNDILRNSRVVLIVGKRQLEKVFSEEQIISPELIVGSDLKLINEIIKQAYKEKSQKLKYDKKEMNEYYALAEEDIFQRIKRNKPRILFVTSYFTTVLQYHIRDLKQAAEKKGMEVELLKEKGAIYRIFDYDYCSVLNSFRPDIIVSIDHFRFENSFIPKEIVWVCWAQDPMPYVMDKNTPQRLGNNDFVLNHFTTWNEFHKVGYNIERLIDAPIPSNEKIYKPYTLSQNEQENYNCDICFVCHASDVDVHISEIVEKFPKEFENVITAVYETYKMKAYRSGKFYYTQEEFENYIITECWDYLKVGFSVEIIDVLASDMYLWFNQRVFRETLVDWILEAGFENVKLWGNGWKKNPKYSRYAMGPAENGETLSKIYQASKIVIGNNIMTTAAARAWETMLSGGFYLSNYIPPEADVTDIRKIVEVDKDVIMFFDREDLIQKLHYYLEHEEERKRMAAQGRKVALEKMTFGRLMEKMLKEIADRL